MANRHKAFYKKGGGVHGAPPLGAGNKDVAKEAFKRKAGGEVGKVTGKAAGGRLDRKRGGKVKEESKAHEKKESKAFEAKEEAKAKASGGSIGGKSVFSSAGGGSADKSPFFK